MNQKTDLTNGDVSSQEEEFTLGFIPSLIALTLVILIGIIVSEQINRWLPDNEWIYLTDKPPLITFIAWTFASFKTVSDGLSAFSGKPIILPSLTLKIGTLTSIIAVYIFIPTVFFFNWRKRRIDRISGPLISSLNLSSIWYALSITLTLSVTIVAIASALYGYQMRQSILHIITMQSERDKIINELNLVKMDVYQYKLLPREKGGGNGTYEGLTLDPSQAKTQNGIYTITIQNRQVSITAQSLLFPSGTIDITVDEQGQTGKYIFKGAFAEKE